jgi:hypothetical protein
VPFCFCVPLSSGVFYFSPSLFSLQIDTNMFHDSCAFKEWIAGVLSFQQNGITPVLILLLFLKTEANGRTGGGKVRPSGGTMYRLQALRDALRIIFRDNNVSHSGSYKVSSRKLLII